jgi:putative endonuclease
LLQVNETTTMAKGGSVYIMTNQLRTVLYIGVTSDLRSRVTQHKEHFYKGSFTDQYNCTICVYYENFSRIEEAIAREKEIKKWRREKKDKLISAMNKHWVDLWNEIETW